MNWKRFHIWKHKQLLIRRFSNKSDSYFVTAPIFYVNGPPHLGHLYTALFADASHRWHLMKTGNNSQTIFSIGTDEHGLKIQQAAQTAGIAPLEYCNSITTLFRKLFFQFDVAHTDFVRTTERRHVEAVRHFWDKLSAAGFIYKGKYSGWYSAVDEAFYSDSEIQDFTDEQGTSYKVATTTNNRVELTEETNYMFTLSKFSDRLRQWLTTSDVIQPSAFLPYALSILDTGGCRDLSISREASRLKWAIDVPGDETQKVYVWFDALINYLTVAGYPNAHPLSLWPPDCQVLGRDIVKFHAIVWPALLMALDLPLPKKLLVHGHWLADGVKMSKSRGNVVDPLSEASILTTEGLRYFMLRQGVPHDDASYSRRKAVQAINDELANNLGNLISRTSGKKMNREQFFPPFDADLFKRDYSEDGPALVEGLHYMSDKVAEHYDHLYFYKGIQLIQTALRQTNAFCQYHKPWTHVDAEGNPLTLDDEKKLYVTVHVTFQALRLCGLLLQPIVPNLANRLLSRLGVPQNERSFEYCRVFEKCPTKLENKPLGSLSAKVLFAKLKDDEK